MATFFRIVQAHLAATAMTGEGARASGGRWNPPGIPAVYLAESRALAALEILVHAAREAIPLAWCVIEVVVPDPWIKTAQPAELPGDWRALPSSPGARNFGERWLLRMDHLALKLPSTVIPEEHALLFNPLHPDAAKVSFSAPRAFHFDARL